MIAPSSASAGRAQGASVGPIAYTETETILVLVAALAFLGALIHVGAAIDHWAEYHLYTLVFSCLAALQTCWALLILRGASWRVLALGCVMQTGIVALWIVSRTAGVPLAPKAWTPEGLGVADLVESIGELTTVLAVSTVLLGERWNAARAVRRYVPAALVFVILISALFGTGAHAG